MTGAPRESMEKMKDWFFPNRRLERAQTALDAAARELEAAARGVCLELRACEDARLGGD